MTSSIKNTCLTRSAIAIAPTNEAILAFSPFSIPAPSLMMPSFMTELCVGGLWLAVYSPTTEFRTVSANKSEPSFETDPKVFPGTAGYASKVYEAVSAREPWCASLKVSAIVCKQRAHNFHWLLFSTVLPLSILPNSELVPNMNPESFNKILTEQGRRGACRLLNMISQRAI